MADSAAHRVFRRFVDSSRRLGVLAHVDRDGVSWGWFADRTPRMHLVPLAPERHGVARVWLEDSGIRCFHVDYLNTDRDLDIEALRASVQRSRDTIESAWLRSCEPEGSPQNLRKIVRRRESMAGATR